MEKVHLAIIGGTGLYDVPGLEVVDSVFPDTAWGNPSDSITVAKLDNLLIAFLPRHGKGHFYSPTNIPQLANMAALKSLGVEEIVAFSSVGSLQEEIAPTHFVLPSQIIDRTRHRDDTFYDGGIVVHVSFGDPFDAELSAILEKHIKATNVPLHTDQTLICMEGPQFSTRAESKLYRSWGAGIINMTAVPEAKLARELEMSYQMVCMSTDYDSWRESEEAVTTDQILKTVHENTENAKKVIQDMLPDFLPRVGKDSHWKGSVKFGILTSPHKRSEEDRLRLNALLPGYF
ncbi:MAG: S-methyl-5'-thioadenosine phosphorylase [Leptospirales bacterium]